MSNFLPSNRFQSPKIRMTQHIKVPLFLWLLLPDFYVALGNPFCPFPHLKNSKLFYVIILMSGIINCWIPLKGQPLAVRASSTYSHIQLIFFLGGAVYAIHIPIFINTFLPGFPHPNFLLFSSNPTHPKRLNSNAKSVSVPPLAPRIRDRDKEGTQVTI